MLSHALQNGPPSLTELEPSSASRTKKERSFECRRRFLRRSAVGARRMPLSTGCSMVAGSSLSIWSRALPGEPVPCSLALDSGPRTLWTRLSSRRRSSSAAPSLRRGIRRTWGAFRRVFATCECLRFEITERLGNAHGLRSRRSRVRLVRGAPGIVIDLKTRRVHVAGVSHSPDGAWMAQVARNLTDAASSFLKEARHLIVDRDPLYTAHFEAILASSNVELLRLPARSPNLNAYAERFVGSIKSECLRHIVPIGERHLRAVVREYVMHYHHERKHQGLDNVIPLPLGQPGKGAIRRHERLGGVLGHYRRDAA